MFACFSNIVQQVYVKQCLQKRYKIQCILYTHSFKLCSSQACARCENTTKHTTTPQLCRPCKWYHVTANLHVDQEEGIFLFRLLPVSTTSQLHLLTEKPFHRSSNNQGSTSLCNKGNITDYLILVVIIIIRTIALNSKVMPQLSKGEELRGK